MHKSRHFSKVTFRIFGASWGIVIAQVSFLIVVFCIFVLTYFRHGISVPKSLRFWKTCCDKTHTFCGREGSLEHKHGPTSIQFYTYIYIYTKPTTTTTNLVSAHRRLWEAYSNSAIHESIRQLYKYMLIETYKYTCTYIYTKCDVDAIASLGIACPLVVFPCI